VSKPKVLLLEAGGPNDDTSLRLPEGRFTTLMNPSMNYGYESTPQAHLDNRKIACPRGRGLGGSSAINFSCWLVGHKEDFNQWATLVGDDCWNWEGENGVKERFKKIENLHAETDPQQPDLFDQDALADHSRNGMVDLSYNRVWSKAESLTYQAAKEWGVSFHARFLYRVLTYSSNHLMAT
jgi:choline dehydrogenase-like flavoprotein